MRPLQRRRARIAEQAAHLDAATHRLLTDLREFDESGEWYKQAAQSCAHWLSWRVGWDLKTAKQHVRVATKLGGLPLIDEALRLGTISYAKVRAITRVATPANEATLLEYAEHSTAAQLETICRKYRSVLRGEEAANEQDDRVKRFVWRRDLDNRMVQVSVTLHPEEAALLYEAMNKIAAERKRVDSERSGGVVDCAANRTEDAMTATCRDGDEPGNVLAACRTEVFLDGHHAIHWADGGETKLANLVGLCGFHHRFLHEYGFRVVMDENQHPTFFDARGREISEAHPTPDPRVSAGQQSSNRTRSSRSRPTRRSAAGMVTGSSTTT